MLYGQTLVSSGQRTDEQNTDSNFLTIAHSDLEVKFLGCPVLGRLCHCFNKHLNAAHQETAKASADDQLM